ncbi:unnamed protein product [Paramecium sonneborni]|uniref:Uncharacterized protein n=1 Tax=Paramecium sonneborni TaxID=65129 RepID=A0A8S1MKI7_9CILI|nr:unnamed protein product [Paramecium sonneborni]
MIFKFVLYQHNIITYSESSQDFYSAKSNNLLMFIKFKQNQQNIDLIQDSIEMANGTSISILVSILVQLNYQLIFTIKQDYYVTTQKNSMKFKKLSIYRFIINFQENLINLNVFFKPQESIKTLIDQENVNF